MASYLKMVETKMSQFENVEIHQVLRIQNSQVDALARLATCQGSVRLSSIDISRLSSSAFTTEEINSIHAQEKPNWMTPII